MIIYFIGGEKVFRIFVSLHVQCNRKRIVDYPNIWGYLRDLYSMPAFGETTNRFHIEHHYQV